MGKTNPFLAGRSEFEPEPVFYMPNSMLEWVGRQPLIFEGHRGSGKSSILKSLSWQAMWRTSGIEVDGPPEVRELYNSPSHLGAYWRAEEMDIGYWETWRDQYGDESAQKYFGTYLDFLFIDLLLDAIQGVRKCLGKHFIDSRAERGFVTEMLHECFSSPKFRPQLAEESFAALRNVAKSTHLGIRDLIYLQASFDEMTESYPVTGPGLLLKSFGNAFLKHYSCLSDWTVLLLLDDCNHLSEWQTRVVNSAIAKVAIPITYKLTSVIGLYKSRLTIDGRPVNEHELKRVVVPSAKPTDSMFAKMAQGVCRVRISKHYDRKKAKKFNFKKFLGPFELETLLERKLRDSEKDESVHLRRQAMKDAENERRSLSITSTWLSSKDVRKEREVIFLDRELHKKQLRHNMSVYKKKWNHVAAIALCKEFHLDFPYCGWRTILHLSNGSIREMLRIMSRIWDVSRLEVDRFVTQVPLDAAIQTRAIYEVADASFKSIDDKPVFDHSTLPEICRRLGKLFSKCQSYPYICTTPETASIRIKLTDVDDDIATIIEMAVMSGVMLRCKSDETIAVGLHPVLSPEFKISFRNPFYYPESITQSQLQRLFKGDKKTADKVVKEILEARMQRYRSKHGDKDKGEDEDTAKQKTGRPKTQKYLFELDRE